MDLEASTEETQQWVKGNFLKTNIRNPKFMLLASAIDLANEETAHGVLCN